MEKDFFALDLGPLVQEIAETARKLAGPAAPEDEVTEKIFIGTEGAELEMFRWAQGPEFFFN